VKNTRKAEGGKQEPETAKVVLSARKKKRNLGRRGEGKVNNFGSPWSGVTRIGGRGTLLRFKKLVIQR